MKDEKTKTAETTSDQKREDTKTTHSATPRTPERDKRVFSANYTATGRRKTSVARVLLTPGKGTVTINECPARQYLPTEILLRLINQPFQVTGLEGRFDVAANVSGGGFSGQAGAISHGISRALSLIDETTRMQLKVAGLLTRDARMRERKKYGQRGARARFQFSKR